MLDATAYAPFRVDASISRNIVALRLASRKSEFISPTSCGSICVRPDKRAIMDAGVSSWSAYLHP
jgi:hypothetical protein